MKKICDSCSKENHERAKFCTGCGKGLASATPMPNPSPFVEAPSVAAPKPTPMRAPKPLMNSEANKSLAGPPGHNAPTMFAEAAVSGPAPRPVATPAPFSAVKEPSPPISTASLPTMFAPPEDVSAPRSTGGIAAVKPEGAQVKLGEKLVVRTPAPSKAPKPTYDPSAVTPAIPVPTPRPMMPRHDPAAMTLQANDDPNVTPHMETLPAHDEVEPVPTMMSPASSMSRAPAADTSPCPRCSTPIQIGFIFCGRCGFDMRTQSSSAAPVDDVATPESQKGPVPDLVLLTPDGQESNRFTLAFGDITIGRASNVEIPCPENFFLSEQHSTFSWDGQRLVLRDLQSFNGTFIKLKAEARLSNNDYLCIGQQFLRFELCEIVPSPSQAADGTYRHGAPLPEMGARLILIGMGGLEFDVYYLRNEETTVGRVSGDIIFSKDNFISRAHAKIVARDGVFFLSDLGSSNGTFLQICGEIELSDNELLLMGDQLFRIELPR
jgi:pSer/pThr/pTyr-binding forkhead associated (FHA) protein